MKKLCSFLLVLIVLSIVLLGAVPVFAVSAADLSVTLVDSPDPVQIGHEITYTIVITNTGPNNADLVLLTAVLPAGTAFQFIQTPAGFSAVTPPVGGTGTITAAGSTMPSGSSAMFTLILQVLTAGDITMTVTSTTASFDMNLGNNSSTTTTTTVLNGQPTVVSGQETQTGHATPAAAGGSPAAVSYSADASTWFTDPDNQVLTFSVVSAVDSSANNVAGDVAFTGTTLTYTPDVAQAGKTVTILVRAFDGALYSVANVTVSIAVAAPPVAVLSVSTPANGLYGIGSILDFVVRFGNPVTVTGQPELKLALDGKTASATYLSGNGSNDLTFRYLVAEGDQAANFTHSSLTALDLNGGSINDAVGGTGPAILTLPAAGPNVAIVIDAIRPVLTAQKADDAIVLSFNEAAAAKAGLVKIADGTTAYTAAGTTAVLSADKRSANILFSNFTGLTWQPGVLYTISLEAGAFADLAGNSNVAFQATPFLTGISGLATTYDTLTGGQLPLAPAPAGGNWAYDDQFLTLNGNTFTTLKAGTTHVTYSVLNQTYAMNIVITDAEIPVTGENDQGLLIGLLLAAAAFALTRLRHRLGRANT